MRPDKTKHRSHDHLLIRQQESSLYICDLCGQPGFDMPYACEPCEFHAHKRCAFASPDAPIKHRLFKDCGLLRLSESRPRGGACDACGDAISGYHYYCKDHCGVQLHPSCAELPTEIPYPDLEPGTLALRKKPMLWTEPDCLWCRNRKPSRGSSKWSYVSTGKEPFRLHIACARAMLLQIWEEEYYHGDGKESATVNGGVGTVTSKLRMAAASEKRKAEGGLGSKLTMLAEIVQIMAAAVIGVVTGDPLSLISAVASIVQLFSRSGVLRGGSSTTTPSLATSKSRKSSDGKMAYEEGQQPQCTERVAAARGRYERTSSVRSGKVCVSDDDGETESSLLSRPSNSSKRNAVVTTPTGRQKQPLESSRSKSVAESPWPRERQTMATAATTSGRWQQRESNRSNGGERAAEQKQRRGDRVPQQEEGSYNSIRAPFSSNQRRMASAESRERRGRGEEERVMEPELSGAHWARWRQQGESNRSNGSERAAEQELRRRDRVPQDRQLSQCEEDSYNSTRASFRRIMPPVESRERRGRGEERGSESESESEDAPVIFHVYILKGWE